MARVAEDKVRQLVETSPLRPENVLRNSDPALIGMMVERLSRELHERTNQMHQMHPKFSRVGVMDLFASTNRKPISKRTPPKV